MTLDIVRVGDVLRMERTKIAPQPGSRYRQIGIYSWGKGIIENQWVDGADLSKVDYYQFPSNALMMSNIQAWEAAIAVSTKQHEGFIASQRFLPYVPIDADRVDVRYLWHFFLSDPGLALIRAASPGTVTRNRTLGQRAFENCQIPLPAFAVQTALRTRLDQSSTLSIKIHDQLAVGSARIRAVRERVLEEANSSGSEYALGELLTPVRNSTRVESGETYLSVGLFNRGRGVFRRSDVRGSETSYSTLFPLSAGQLVYSKLFAWEGSIAIVPSWAEGYYVSSEFPHYEINDLIVNPEFLGSLIRTDRFVEQLRSLVTGMGQRRQRVNPEQFLCARVCVPSIARQTVAAQRLRRLDQAEECHARRAGVAAALPRAARNEVFSKLV